MQNSNDVQSFYPRQDRFQSGQAQISVRRDQRRESFALLWFFAAAVTLVLSMTIARLVA